MINSTKYQVPSTKYQVPSTKYQVPSTKWLVLVCAILFAPFQLLAQPQLSYMIPDLGTTRFATYVEFVGPHNAKGNFGADGLYLNNPGDAVRVRCLNPNDTTKVKIGPVSVSWDGRLVSTHVFVLPTIIPNSDRWQDVAAQFQIPLVVEVNGLISAPETFYIVRPFAFGDRRSDPDRILGEGALGRRSKRGAMIVDSMVLASNAQYTVSLVDPDGDKAGNQGYLPFVLLSVGNVYGGASTEIHADADAANGGPGGGGGGGGYANFSLGSNERGFDGGNGYTGGAPGGYNNSSIPLAPPNSKRKPGTGSGENLPADNNNARGSASLNGNPGGESFVGVYENAGGGTGHPFGTSGVGCTDRNSCDPIGGAGGGSGGREGQRGGGGGYGTAGQNESGRQNGGKIHGNECLVPLAGGSGGASGNPSGTSRSSSGGGGGGAISLHGLRLWDFDVFVRGASPSAIDVRGGAGSGGGVIVGMRLDNAGFGFVGAQLGSQTGNGFLEGGRGRARYDASLDPIPGVYVGPLLDTLTASLRDVEMLGHGDQSDLYIYAKGERTPWIILDTISGYTGSWRRTIRLPGTDTLYFIAVGQSIPLPKRTDEVHDPGIVFSQSAWNIIRLFGPPIIVAPSDVDLGVYACEGREIIDTIEIGNEGESPLEISNAAWAGSPGFTLVEPTVFPDTLAPYTKKKYVVRYVAPVGATGPQAGQLVLDNNDTTGGKTPWRINYKVDIRLVNLSYRFRGRRGDTADIGNLCVNALDSESVTVFNDGQDPVTYQRFVSLDPSLIDVSSTNTPATRDPAQAFNLTFELVARRIGPALVPALLYVNDCPSPDTIWLKFTGVDPRLTRIGTGQFGVVPIGTTRQTQIELRNDGTTILDISGIPPVAPPLTLVSAVPAPPATLQPGESMVLTYEFAPTAPGQATASFWVRTSDTLSFFGMCLDSVEVILAGIGANVDIVADPGTLVFPAIGSCEEDTMTTMIRNDGATEVTLMYPAVLNGPDAADFAIDLQPESDTTLFPGEVALYRIVFSPRPGPNATRSAMLTVLTDQPAQPQVDVGLSGARATVILDGPRTVDLGLIPVGATTTRTVSYTNNSGFDVEVVRITSSAPAIVTATPQAFVVNNGGTQNVDINVLPLIETSRTDTLYIVTSSPCLDSFAVLVTWTSESPDMGIQNILAFGDLSNCEFKVDSIVIANTSSFPVDLIDVNITGPDAALFTVLNPAAATGVILDPLDTAVLHIQFDPRGSTDGPKSAELTTRVRISNQPRSFITQLTGRRRTTIPSTPDDVRFGSVDIQTTNSQLVTIVNVGTDPINITEIRMAGTSGGIITVQVPALPILLQPGQRLDVVVQFAPTETRGYVDSVLVFFDQPCADLRPIPVSGTGRLNVEFILILPQFILDPTDDSVRLPIKGYVESGFTGDVVADLNLTLSFASPLFVAQSLSQGTIVRNEVVAGRTELELEVKNVGLTTKESTLFEIHGQATIGPLDSTDLVVDEAVATAEGTSPKVRSEDGWLKLELCEEGGIRLVTRTGSLFLRATPNPASEDLTIEVGVFEKGIHTLEMISTTGQIVATRTWDQPAGGGVHTEIVDVRGIATGTYVLRLTTPTRERTISVVIIH